MIGQFVSHYTIIEKLGGGGMGVVYKAQDTKLRREVALKFLPPGLTCDEEARQRFNNEAQAASSLDHPNICTIYEIDETEDGQLFIAMAYYEGETLKQQMSRGDLQMTETIGIAIQIAEGLAKAHRHGIMHRDLKPANVFVTGEGVVKILDFGLAKLSGVARLTKTGQTMGTIAYMSPEQAQGLDADQRSDIWSFGVLLYEMITGRLPFTGDFEPAMIYSIMNEDAEPVSRWRTGVPVQLGRIVNKATAKHPDERYQSMDEALNDLRAIAMALELETSAHARPGVVTERRKRPLSYGRIIAGLAVLLLGIALALWRHGESIDTAFTSDRYRLAVLPLANISPDAKDEYFADGMTEELISTLSKIGQLRVIARTSVMRYKGTEKDIAAIGRELRVGTIIEGSVRKAGTKLRITAHLVDVHRQEPLWSHDYDCEHKEIFEVQSDIAQRVAAALQAELLAGDKNRIEKRATDNFEAYTAYLKGRFLWNQRTTEDLKKAIKYFEQAIAQDSTYALAYAGLADVYAIQGTVEYGGLSSLEAIAKATAAVEKALAVDRECAEARVSLANIRYAYEWDWTGAEREFKHAIALNQNNALAHHWYAHYLAARGRLDEALTEIKLAQELDPLSLIINTSVGMVFYFRRQPDKAIEQLRQTLDIDPNFVAAHLQLGVFYVHQHRFTEAVAEFEKAIDLGGENPITLALLGHAYAASGKRSDALAILAKLQQSSLLPFVSPSHLALLHLGLGDKERVFEWLEKAYEQRSNYLIYLKVEPLVDGLRSDPRFSALLKKMSLEK